MNILKNQKPKWEDLPLKNRHDGILQKCQVTKDKGKLWKYSRLKELKQKWQLNAIFDPRLDLALKGEKCYKGHPWVKLNKMGVWMVNYCLIVKFVEVDNILWL